MRSFTILLVNIIWLCCAQEVFRKGKIFNGASDQRHIKKPDRMFKLTGIKLGQGAFGEVHEAISGPDQTKWALKFALDNCGALGILESAKRGNELYGNPVYYHFDYYYPSKSFIATPLISGPSLQEKITSSIREKITFEAFSEVIFGPSGVLEAIVNKLHNRDLVHNDLWVHASNIYADFDHKTNRYLINFIDFDSLIESNSKRSKTFELITFLNMVVYQWQSHSSRQDLESSMKGFDWTEYAEVPFKIAQGDRYILNQAKLEAFKKYIFENDVFQNMLKTKETVNILGLVKLDRNSKWTFTFDLCSKKAEIVEADVKSKFYKSDKIRSALSACKDVFLPRNWKE